MVCPHNETGPEMILGAIGFLVMAVVKLLLPQVLVACNVNVPNIVPAATVTFIDGVPCPEVMVNPVGTVQL